MPLGERIIWLLMWAQFICAGVGTAAYLLSPNLLNGGQTTLNLIGGIYTAICLRSVRRVRAEREAERAAYA
ncbi:hypothetical protein [Aeromicrobium sp. 179-A 4D2 NHS]|uniref:hypothetical protein n=1 Tax=Aeromicrobium sp. 179-A 4D2 NHS TaxID=3142375 RepID=UPI0039A23A50